MGISLREHGGLILLFSSSSDGWTFGQHKRMERVVELCRMSGRVKYLLTQSCHTPAIVMDDYMVVVGCLILAHVILHVEVVVMSLYSMLGLLSWSLPTLYTRGCAVPSRTVIIADKYTSYQLLCNSPSHVRVVNMSSPTRHSSDEMSCTSERRQNTKICPSTPFVQQGNLPRSLLTCSSNSGSEYSVAACHTHQLPVPAVPLRTSYARLSPCNRSAGAGTFPERFPYNFDTFA